MEVGKTYKVTHSRKGTFVVEVTKMTAVWMTGVMQEGTTWTMISGNQKGVGDEVTLRIGFLRKIEEVE